MKQLTVTAAILGSLFAASSHATTEAQIRGGQGIRNINPVKHFYPEKLPQK
jgi:hypothetical protein